DPVYATPRHHPPHARHCGEGRAPGDARDPDRRDPRLPDPAPRRHARDRIRPRLRVRRRVAPSDALRTSPPMMAADYVRRSVAEFVGTFALIFVGAGAVIYGDIVGVALANGLVIAVMVSAVGLISGGFFNPAITIGFLITRRIAPSLGVLYLVVQFGAAALAALLLRWVLPPNARIGSHLGAPMLGTGVSSGKGVAIEAVLTFFLLWAVFATAVDPRGTFKQIAGLAIGLTIVFDALMGLGLTGAAMNPAR